MDSSGQGTFYCFDRQYPQYQQLQIQIWIQPPKQSKASKKQAKRASKHAKKARKQRKKAARLQRKQKKQARAMKALKCDSSKVPSVKTEEFDQKPTV